MANYNPPPWTWLGIMRDDDFTEPDMVAAAHAGVMKQISDSDSGAKRQQSALAAPTSVERSTLELHLMRRMRSLLVAFRMGGESGCWCEVAIGNPMLAGKHTDRCKLAKVRWAELESEGE